MERSLWNEHEAGLEDRLTDLWRGFGLPKFGRICLACMKTKPFDRIHGDWRMRARGRVYPVGFTGGIEGRHPHGLYPTPWTELLLGVHDDMAFRLARGAMPEQEPSESGGQQGECCWFGDGIGRGVAAGRWAREELNLRQADIVAIAIVGEDR